MEHDSPTARRRTGRQQTARPTKRELDVDYFQSIAAMLTAETPVTVTYVPKDTGKDMAPNDTQKRADADVLSADGDTERVAVRSPELECDRAVLKVDCGSVGMFADDGESRLVGRVCGLDW